MTAKTSKKDKKETCEDVNYDGSTPLINKKQEKFVLACIENFGNKTKSYKAVFGDESPNVRVMASRYFVSNVNIQVRYQYLVREGLKSASLSVEERLTEIREQMYVAMEEGNHSAYKGYQELIMRLQGEDSKKVDITSNGKAISNDTNINVSRELIEDVVSKFDDEF